MTLADVKNLFIHCEEIKVLMVYNSFKMIIIHFPLNMDFASYLRVRDEAAKN